MAWFGFWIFASTFVFCDMWWNVVKRKYPKPPEEPKDGA